MISAVVEEKKSRAKPCETQLFPKRLPRHIAKVPMPPRKELIKRRLHRTGKGYSQNT